MKLRRFFSILMATVLLIAMTIPAQAAPSQDAKPYIQKLLNYYRYYQTDASEEIDALLDTLEDTDPAQGEAWRKIMNTWEWVDQSMTINYGVLPDGLTNDRSLGIVVMGYALTANGGMRQELVDRLTVALASAEKYPNAYIICTGGATASNSRNTEAGVMAQWLQARGVSKDRIITEAASYSTTQNALNTYQLLDSRYPFIRSLAVITSDYHVYRSFLAFSAASDYASSVNGTAAIEVISNACCWTIQESRESLNTQAETLAMIAGMNLEYQARPALFETESSASSGNGSWNVTYPNSTGSLWSSGDGGFTGTVQPPLQEAPTGTGTENSVPNQGSLWGSGSGSTGSSQNGLWGSGSSVTAPDPSVSGPSDSLWSGHVVKPPVPSDSLWS